MRSELSAFFESLFHNRSAEWKGYRIYRTDTHLTCPTLGAEAKDAKDLIRLIEEKIGR